MELICIMASKIFSNRCSIIQFNKSIQAKVGRAPKEGIPTDSIEETRVKVPHLYTVVKYVPSL